MRTPRPSVDPYKNAYLLGIAARLHLEPQRVECNVRVGPTGGILLDIRIDGRDPTGAEETLIAEYLEEAFHGTKPRVLNE
jgi:hypothetical protein